MERHKIFTFVSRGLTLSAQTWWPRAYPRGIFIAVHGWAEHGGRFTGLAQYLVNQGYAVYALDMIGHGLSGGRRGHVGSVDDMVADVAMFINVVQSQWRSVPLYLCGYGLGGCVAALYIIDHPHDVDGVVFVACALEEGKDISPLKRTVAWLVGGILPYLPLSYVVSGAQLSRIPEEIAAYDNDPLVYHGKMNAGTGRSLLFAVHRLTSRLERISTPFLVLQGDKDPMVNPASGTAIHQRAASIDKTMHRYPEALHDLLHEQERSLVFGDILEWLDLHTGQDAFTRKMASTA